MGMAFPTLRPEVRNSLSRGVVIPAHPLALTAERRLDERRQRALSRYYLAAGAGGLAVGVHTTQFAIHDPRIGLLRPVLELAVEQMRRHEQRTGRPVIRIAGICGPTEQATREATQAVELGYDVGLLSLSALRTEPVVALIAHAQAVAEVIPIMGFYLQPAVGGRVLPVEFWRELALIDNLVAIKMAPFNRYQTNDVIRAVAESGRAGEIALYTGNDDHIIADLLTPHTFVCSGMPVTQRIVGGLLGALVGLDAEGRRATRCHPCLDRETECHPVRMAAPRRRDHGRQRRVLRCRQRFCRLHRRFARGTPPAGAPGWPVVPGSLRGIVAKSDGRNRPRFTLLIPT